MSGLSASVLGSVPQIISSPSSALSTDSPKGLQASFCDSRDVHKMRRRVSTTVNSQGNEGEGKKLNSDTNFNCRVVELAAPLFS